MNEHEVDANIESFKKLVDAYGIEDKDEVYTSGCVLIPVFRVEQFLEYLKSKMG